jgi:hypothetical protein
MFCPSQSSWLYHPNDIWWGAILNEIR